MRFGEAVVVAACLAVACEGYKVQELRPGFSKAELSREEQQSAVTSQERVSRSIDTSSDISNQIEQGAKDEQRGGGGGYGGGGGGGKKGKGGGMGLMVGMMFAAYLYKAMAAVALLAGKALIVGKIALVLAAIIGLKKLLSSEHKEHEIVVHRTPVHTEEHVNHYDHHDHLRRRIWPGAHELAYAVQAKANMS